jgi:hypothetical protein
MSYPVVIPYDPAWRPLEWAKKHCPSYITNDAVTITDPNSWGTLSLDGSRSGVRYFFKDKEDAAYFKLTWA